MPYEEVLKNEGIMTTIDATIKPKWRAHETFFIRKGWLSKGLQAVAEKDDIFVDKNVNQMDELGIGSNMVKSLRYWLQATGVTREEADKDRRGRRVQRVTELGKLVLENDPYLEDIGTLWVLHYELVNKREFVPSWYFVFNELKMKSFTQDDFVRLIDNYSVNILGADKPPAARLSTDDFNCILGTYISKGSLQASRVSPESNIDCPFGELELLGVDSLRDKTYRKKQAAPDLIPDFIALYAILRFREERGLSGNALRVEDLLNTPASPGKAFNLDTFSLLEILRRLESRGFLRVIRTAGLDEVRIESDMSPIECLEEHYEEVG